MSVEVLLTKTAMILEKYDTICQKTGGHFNIFEIANIAYDEVTICRVICELLSPGGSHYQGDVYLRLFFKYVLHMDISKNELAAAKVYREYRIDEQRRIDLVIETKTVFIPIEVKIYATDQYEQCYDYFKYARNVKHMKHPKIYYLTRFGVPPSEDSARGLTPIKGTNSYDEVVELSFADDILNWLNMCLKETRTLQIAPIREVLLQLIKTIQKFTDQLEDEKQMEIKELLLSSADNLKNAVVIHDAVNEARKNLLIQLFEKIDQRVGRSRLINEYDFADDNYKKIRNYYDRKGNTWPGISYFYKDKKTIKKDKDIWVRLELTDTIFVGYCCPTNGKATSYTLNKDDIKNILKVEPSISNWWAYYEDVNLNESRQIPNFKQHNDAYYALLEKNNFESFAECCANRIIALLDR